MSDISRHIGRAVGNWQATTDAVKAEAERIRKEREAEEAKQAAANAARTKEGN